MKQKNDAMVEIEPRPARKRKVSKAKARSSVMQVNQEGEWMGGEGLRGSLLSLLSTPNEITLDLAGLTHVDAASFQVLVSAAQSEAFASGKLRLANVSEQVRSCFRYAGADTLLTGSGEVR